MTQPAPATIAQTLAGARACKLERLDADLLLLHALGVDAARSNQGRGWLLAHDTDPLEPELVRQYQQLVQRRRAGEPLAYIVGHKEFFGLDLQVDPRVLVPRPDTETLVEWALQCIDARQQPDPGTALRVLDLGTGSGAIALALKHQRPSISVDAVDASGEALALARANAARLGLDLHWLLGSWYDPVCGRYDCIVSNPPYVRDGDPHLAELIHEPMAALTAGPDGLRDIRLITRGAARHLRPGGWLLLEHGNDQGAQVGELLQSAGLRNISVRHDLAGRWRCSGGQMDPQGTGPAAIAALSGPGR